MKPALVALFLVMTVSFSTRLSGTEVRPGEYREVERLILSAGYDEAAEKLKTLLEKNPGDQLFNRALGYCLENTRDYDGAVKACRNAIEAGDLSADTQARAGRCLQKLNRFEEALEHYLAALDKPLRPDGKAGVLSGLAECQSRLGRDAEYREYMTELLRVDPESARLIEARALVRDGKHERALTILRKLNERDKENSQIAHELARSLIEQGKDPEFAERLLSAIHAGPEVGKLDIDLARCHLHINRQEYEKTMRLKGILEDTGHFTPDQKAYRERILEKIERTFH